MSSLRSNPTNLIAFGILTYAVTLTVVVFVLGRTNPSTSTAVVLCVTNTISTLLGIGGGLLGQQVLSSKTNPADLPPGSITTSKDTVQTPPITAPSPVAEATTTQQ